MSSRFAAFRCGISLPPGGCGCNAGTVWSPKTPVVLQILAVQRFGYDPSMGSVLIGVGVVAVAFGVWAVKFWNRSASSETAAALDGLGSLSTGWLTEHRARKDS